jgi:DNA-binding transcriptional MocR family regulator
MNEIYKERIDTELAEKLGCKVYKEGVGLFVWAKLRWVTSAEVFIESCMKSILLRRNYFGSNGEGYIQFTLCVKKKKLEAISRF